MTRSSTKPAEVSEIHTRLLRLSLAVEESRAYWENVDPSLPPEARPDRAFEERWFGAKSMARVKLTLANMVVRFSIAARQIVDVETWPAVVLHEGTRECPVVRANRLQ